MEVGRYGSSRTAPRACEGGSEARGLRVHAPLVPQRVADLAEGGLRADRVQHRGDHVRAVPGGRQHGVDRGADLGVVTAVLALAEDPDLLPLDLVADPEDLQVAGDGAVVDVDADDALVALLQGALVLEGGLGDLAGEPAVLDAAQDAGGDRPDRVAGRPGGRGGRAP